MEDRIAVAVHADDPVTQAGLAAQLRGQPGVAVVDDTSCARVAVVTSDRMDDDTGRRVRTAQRQHGARVVVVVSDCDDAGLLAAVEAGASGLLRRRDASPERLSAAVRAAANGEGTMPPDLLGRLLGQVNRLHSQVLAPRGLTFSGLTDREVAVLRLVADGFDTADIARRLNFSERTIKNVIHDLTNRLQVRNRAHAVAYAVRAGLI